MARVGGGKRDGGGWERTTVADIQINIRGWFKCDDRVAAATERGRRSIISRKYVVRGEKRSWRYGIFEKEGQFHEHAMECIVCARTRRPLAADISRPRKEGPKCGQLPAVNHRATVRMTRCNYQKMLLAFSGRLYLGLRCFTRSPGDLTREDMWVNITTRLLHASGSVSTERLGISSKYAQDSPPTGNFRATTKHNTRYTLDTHKRRNRR